MEVHFRDWHNELEGFFPQISVGPKKTISERKAYELIATREGKFSPSQLLKRTNLAMPFLSGWLLTEDACETNVFAKFLPKESKTSKKRRGGAARSTTRSSSAASNKKATQPVYGSVSCYN
mmetsp:Transcript_9604/g.18635  ORF Transcript_9604/g.18635 Transcript_9604/m.18635 type:complete len:121 (-) Transcript_9604:454-816(-)